MLRHEAYCSALNGVAEICTCGALGRAAEVQASRVQAREHAWRSGVVWTSGWLAALDADEGVGSPHREKAVPADL